MATNVTELDANQRVELMERLLTLAAAVGGEVTVDSTLETIFESFSSVIPFDRLEYATTSDDGWEFTTRWVRANYEPVLLAAGTVHRRVSSPGSDLEGHDGLPYTELDMREYASRRPADHPATVLVDEGIRSVLSCPLLVNSEVLGYLFFGSRTPAAYGEFHTWAMTRIAAIVAGAISKAQLADELSQRNRELEDLAAFRTRYLATISHELRTPLTAVVGLAQALHEGFDDFDREEMRELIGLLAQQSGDSARLVEDLLLIARAQAGTLSVSTERFDLREAVTAITTTVMPGIEVNGTGTEVLADSGRVRQIIGNLLTNAQRYGGQRVWVTLGRSDSGTGWVEVCDDGEGIPVEGREAVFQPFVTNRERPADGSVGIGLWVARQLAEAMGGRLIYTRREGASCFRLELPVAERFTDLNSA